MIPVYFDWRFSSLEKIAHECAEKCGGESGLGALRSIGIMTHHKPGAIGLVKGCRATRRNLAKPEVRAFWVSLAKLLASDGRVDILGYDASRCVPTRKLLDDLGELMRVPIDTADAAAVTLAARPRRLRAASTRRCSGRGRVRRRVAVPPSLCRVGGVGAGGDHRRIEQHRGRAAARLASGSGRAGPRNPGTRRGSRRRRRRAALGDFSATTRRPV